MFIYGIYRAAFTTKTVKVGDNSVLFQIWDTAGQEKVDTLVTDMLICMRLCVPPPHETVPLHLPPQYRGLAPMYYRGSAAAVVVYDITNEVRVHKSHLRI